jgi:hypothetical protein
MFATKQPLWLELPTCSRQGFIKESDGGNDVHTEVEIDFDTGGSENDVPKSICTPNIDRSKTSLTGRWMALMTDGNFDVVYP